MAFNVFPPRIDQESPFFLKFHRLFSAHLNTIFAAKVEIYRRQPHACLFRCHKRTLYDEHYEHKKGQRLRPISQKGYTTTIQSWCYGADKNHHRDSPFDTKYIHNHRIIKLVNECTTDVQDTMGKIRRVNLSDVHLMFPSEYVLSHLPDSQTFGRVKKYINHPDIMPI